MNQKNNNNDEQLSIVRLAVVRRLLKQCRETSQEMSQRSNKARLAIEKEADGCYVAEATPELTVFIEIMRLSE